MLFLGCVCHECMLIVYAFVMYVSVYILLCMHFHGYGNACMVGRTCIVVVIVCSSCHHDVVGML